MTDFLINNSDLIIFGILIMLGYVTGSIAEKRHYASIKEREEEMVKLPVVSIRNVYPDSDILDSGLVMGSAVISIDYFKRFLAILRNLFGGRVRSYESLVDRARREAILRMKEKARRNNADIIINFRLETSAIGKSANRKRQIGSVEALAYGTAISLNKT
ncbi:MAG TPA: YbjQ family protein [Desulfobacterales bacterium]|nr:YbjQ family protein [Desulfobacterales bacterium]HIP40020.1 YbjQ family protein [Desulfocapsa sulfexigens]